jgi:uncharacterized membrane protein
MARIEAEIGRSENSHRGELRFAVEVDLGVMQILRGVTARDRAVDLFSALRVWDTEDNTGVLIYLLLADRTLEIVADRGLSARVSQEIWDGIAARMQEKFARKDFEGGLVTGIQEITKLLSKHFPAASGNQNELSNKPVVL